MNKSIYVSPNFDNQTMWQELLVGWLDLVKRYENRKNQTEQDFCYWYNERPLTGLLGAAAWSLADGWSLEEFSAKRRVGDEKKTRGRPDLLIGVREKEAAVEAKIWWIEGRLPAAQANVLKMLDQAQEQLLGLQRWKIQSVSICFVVPWYKGTDGRERGTTVLSEIKRWADENYASTMATAIHISEKDTRWKSREYPGVLLLARQECSQELGRSDFTNP